MQLTKKQETHHVSQHLQPNCLRCLLFSLSPPFLPHEREKREPSEGEGTLSNIWAAVVAAARVSSMCDVSLYERKIVVFPLRGVQFWDKGSQMNLKQFDLSNNWLNLSRIKLFGYQKNHNIYF